MASAHPNGNGYDDMDLDFLDETFPDLLGTVANNELGRVITSPPRAYIDPAQISQPFSGFYEDGSAPLSSVAAAADIRHQMSGHGDQAQTYAAVARRAMSPQQRHQQSTTVQQPADYRSAQQYPVQQELAGQYEPHRDAVTPLPLMRTKTYAEALQSPPVGLDNWLDSLEMFGEFTSGPESNTGGNQVHPQQPSQLLDDAIMHNANFHTGVTDAAGDVEGWVSQPRTARDRIMAPRLDTNHLHPHTPSTHRSPISVASPSSSRMSSRRTKQQLILGNYKHRCDTCQAGFENKADLTHHMRSHTPYQQRPYVCTTCNKRFPYAKDLKRHSVVHATNKIFCPHASCKHAVKGFSRPDHYERHMRTQHAVDSVQQLSQPPSSLGFR